MDLDGAAQEWQTHGFVILPAFVPATELKPALDRLPAMYPTAEGFHDGTDARRDRFTEGGWVDTGGSPDLYDAEIRAAGPAGTVVAWAPGTFHRGTALTLPRGARYTIHLVYRPARAERGQRMPWASCSHEPGWYRFVDRATPRQLALFGFPPPGHPYWTEATVAGTAQRYPRPGYNPVAAGALKPQPAARMS